MPQRHIDHLVLAVHDLDAAAALYERLGFRVGARNRHPWGTENRLIQFGRCFLELITVGESADIPAHGPRAFSFGAFVRDYLARRQGLAMLVLATGDARADAAAFAAAGIGDFEPFFFERRGRTPDGGERRVAFTLAFARDPGAPDAGFFTCQHHAPEHFWNSAWQDHPNGATGLADVALAATQPEAYRRFLETFAGAPATSPQEHDLSLPLREARLDVITPDDAGELYGSVDIDPSQPGFVAFGVRVPDTQTVAARLADEAIAWQQIGSRVVVPASAAFGVAIAFEPA